MANYKSHVKEGGIVAFHVFVQKPFIKPPPEKESAFSYHWKSGQLFYIRLMGRSAREFGDNLIIRAAKDGYTNPTLVQPPFVLLENRVSTRYNNARMNKGGM